MSARATMSRRDISLYAAGSVAGHDSEFAVVTHRREQYPLRAHTPVARKKWELELKKAIGQAT